MALKENYRELLIDAVVRVAARDGLDRTTTKLIAAAARTRCFRPRSAALTCASCRRF